MSYFKKIFITDDYGNDVEATMMNQLKVAESYRLSGGVFNGSAVDTNFYTNIDANGGSCAVSNAELTCAVTTTSGSSTQIYGNAIARYMGGNMNYYRAVFRLGDTGAANNVRTWGVYNILPSTDGLFFQLSNTTFSIVSRKASSNTVVNSGSFNGDGTKSSLSWTVDTNYHTFEIYITHIRAMFVIDGTPIHTIIATTTTMCGTFHLRPVVTNINTGVGSAVSCYSSVMTISRYGTPSSQPVGYYQAGTTAGVTLKTGPGAIHAINISGVSNNANVTIYDNTAASGTVLYSTGSMSANTVPFTVELDGTGALQFNTGLTLVISSANCNCLVRYE